jgi:hypothetical protein
MDMQAMIYQQSVIRVVLFVLSVTGCALFAWEARRRPARRLLLVAPLSWMVNLAMFYACRMAGWPADVYIINAWSQVIHLQALVTLIGGLIIYERK